MQALTHPRLSAARRLMTLRVPRDARPDTAAPRLVPVSFSVIAFSGDEVVFRLAGEAGDCLDLVLNPVVAAAMRDCLALNRLIGPDPRQDGQKDSPG